MSEPTLLEFPCAFPIKAMGRNSGEFQSVVTEIVFRHAQLFSGEQVRTRASGVGNFLSVTITVNAESREQLDRIYHELTDCKQVLQCKLHITGREGPAHFNRKAFPGKLVDHHQELQLPAIFCAISQEVIAPYVVAMPSPVANTTVGAVAGQSTPFSLLFRHLKVFLLP